MDHLLIMLSANQLPEPAIEVRRHADLCLERGQAEILHTLKPEHGVDPESVQRRLVPGQSRVTCYGSGHRYGHRVIGQGVFESIVDYRRLREEEREAFLERNSIYAKGHHPATVVAILRLSGFRTCWVALDVLGERGATFDDGSPVARENLPMPYQSRTALFYTTEAADTADVVGPEDDDPLAGFEGA